MHVKENEIKQMILDSGLVTTDDIIEAEKKAQEKPGTKMTDFLIFEGKISEEDLRRIEGYIVGTPFVDLKGNKIEPDILRIIPEPIARKHNIIAYEKSEKGIEIAMLDTDDLVAIDFIKKKTGQKILPRLTDNESIKGALLQYQRSLKDEFGDIIELESSSISTTNDADDQGPERSEADLKKMADDLPVIRIVETLLNHAVLQGASDVHIEPMENQVLVRYRIDGILEDAMKLPKDAAPSITARIKVLANLKLDEKRLPQDGRFKIETEHEKVSLRVSTLPTSFGEKTVMRLLRESASSNTLENLGFHGKGLEDFYASTKQTTGMILVTGPTGSGKSTTLYTALDILNTPYVNISTVEDPVEYQMKRINQTQVRPDIGLTFASGLRSLLRQDPDILMVGEIRDGETASLAINAALTGHLVLSTLHTNSAAGAIPRFVDMGAEPFLLVSTVEVIVAQRLLRRLCDEREEYRLPQEEIDSLRKKMDVELVVNALREENIIGKEDSLETIPFYKPKKSEECDDGYKGRVGIYEVLRVSSSIKELIRKNASAEDIEDRAKSEGMMTMIEDGLFKAAQGLTSIEEVLRVVSE